MTSDPLSRRGTEPCGVANPCFEHDLTQIQMQIQMRRDAGSRPEASPRPAQIRYLYDLRYTICTT